MKIQIPNSILKALSALFFIAVLQSTHAQTTFTRWSYDPLLGLNTNPTSNIGTGTSALISVGNGSIGNNGVFEGISNITGCTLTAGGNAWQVEPVNPGTINQGTGVQFKASTAGYFDILFSWDQRFSAASANTVRLQYTLNGTTWIDFQMNSGNTAICSGSLDNGRFESHNTNFRRVTVNLSAITGASNNANFGIRIMAAHYRTTGEYRRTDDPTSTAHPGGAWRFDNVIFKGTFINPPTASVLSGTTSICPGSSANLKVDITNGIAPYTVVYSDGTSNFTVLNYNSGAAIPVSPTVNTTYTLVSVKDGSNYIGTGNSGSAIISINVPPTVTLTQPPGKCPGSIDLTPYASPAGGTFSIANPYSGGNTTFTYTYTDPVTGCSATSAPVTFTRNALPAVALSTPPNQCSGAFDLTPYASPAGGTFSIPNPYSGPTTTFTYTYTNPVTGCTSTSAARTFTRRTSQAITSQPVPEAQTTCQGVAFANLTVTADNATSYQWFRDADGPGPGAVAPIAGATSATFTPPSAAAGTTYYILRINGACPAIYSEYFGPFTVTSGSLAGTVSTAQTICPGTTPENLSLTGAVGNVIKWQRANDALFSTGIQDIAVTSTTLSGAAMGPITQTTYFRAFVQNSGGCAEVVTVPVQILIKTTTWSLPGGWDNGQPNSTTSVIFNGDYNSSIDPDSLIEACSVEVISGNVVIAADDVLSVQNKVTVSGGTLTFNNKASLYQKDDVANSGSITYMRTTTPVRRFDYTYWSSPVNAQILASFSPFTLSDKYFWWNQSIYNWQVIAVPGLTVMDIGKGYIIRSPQNYDPVAKATWTGSFAGTPNNGTYGDGIPSGDIIPIVVSGANDQNLLGNPYPSAMDADVFLDENGPNGNIIDGTIYFWTHNTPVSLLEYTYSDFALYNTVGGLGTAGGGTGNTNEPDGTIAAGQGFFVKGINGGGNAIFNNEMRIGVPAKNGMFFRQSSALQKHRIWLEVKNNAGAYKQTLIGYVQNATNGRDRNFDGDVVDGENTVSLYSILDHAKLGIQGRALPFDENDQVLIGFEASQAGNYEINIAKFDGLFQDQPIYLEDKLLGNNHNLKNSSYTFNTVAGTFDNRFVLRYTDSSLGLNNPVANHNTIIVYNNGNLTTVNSGKLDMDSITVYDAAGRLVYSNDAIHSTEINLDLPVLREVFICSIKLADGQIIHKKIIH